MYKIGVLVLYLSVAVAFGSYCNDISGFWQNQLGSNMTIINRSDNRITGEYSTAVESNRGAALRTSNITGTVTLRNDGALFAFTVIFNHGKSLTTWVGQCMVCDGEETLFTTWVLRSHFPKSTDSWLSNNINQDTFKRVSYSSDTIPRHLRITELSENDERTDSCENNLKAGVDGHWISDSSDTMQFDDCSEGGLFSGTYRDSYLYGQTDGGGSLAALGFVSSSSEQVKGWTGHMNENSGEKERKIETSWLIHAFSNNCKDPRSLVRFGKENYTFTPKYKDTVENEPQARSSFNLWSYFS